MTSDDLIRALATRNPYCSDRDGNVACFYCGCYAQFPKGLVRAGGHEPSCIHLHAKALVDSATEAATAEGG